MLTVTHQGTARDAASVHFSPTIRRTDSLVLLRFAVFFRVRSHVLQNNKMKTEKAKP